MSCEKNILHRVHKHTHSFLTWGRWKRLEHDEDSYFLNESKQKGSFHLQGFLPFSLELPYQLLNGYLLSDVQGMRETRYLDTNTKFKK